jgi:hypothetical protein
MKRWAVLTVAIYAIALLLLMTPVILIGFGGWAAKSKTLSDPLELYSYLAFWIWLAVFVMGQMLFLLLPIDTAERRLPARRPVRITVLVTGFFLANLFFTGILSIAFVVLKDSSVDLFPDLSPFESFDTNLLVGVLVCIGAFWILWAFIFRHVVRSDDPESLFRRATRCLLRGSILELLIAIPSHVIVRRREDCCAPNGTFWGIATGISVMLLCFGPGVFFLFVERFRRLQPKDARR